MIKATELRIGSLASGHINERQKEYLSDEYIYVITEIKSLKVNVNLIEDYAMNIYKSTHLPYDKINPIPITEEWLLRFGFQRESLKSSWTLNDEEIWDDLPIGRKIIYQNTPVYYVHQLQNLYYALTGNELEIKEPQPA